MIPHHVDTTRVKNFHEFFSDNLGSDSTRDGYMESFPPHLLVIEDLGKCSLGTGTGPDIIIVTVFLFGRVCICINLGRDPPSRPIVRLHSGIKNLAGSSCDSFGSGSTMRASGSSLCVCAGGFLRVELGIADPFSV